MDKQKTIWKAFMELVNSKEIGVVITRQEIIQYINKETNMYPYGCNWVKDKIEAEYYSPNTVDYIRNLSEKGRLFRQNTSCRDVRCQQALSFRLHRFSVKKRL